MEPEQDQKVIITDHNKYFASVCFVAGFAILSGPGKTFLRIIDDYSILGYSDWITIIGWMVHFLLFLLGTLIISFGWMILYSKKDKGV